MEFWISGNVYFLAVKIKGSRSITLLSPNLGAG